MMFYDISKFTYLAFFDGDLSNFFAANFFAVITLCFLYDIITVYIDTISKQNKIFKYFVIFSNRQPCPAGSRFAVKLVCSIAFGLA